MNCMEIHPVKSYQREVEKSWQNRARRDPHEENKVFRKPDREYPKGSRGRRALEELVRQHGFSKASFYKCKARYSGMSASDLKRLKQLYANLSLEQAVLKDIIEKNSEIRRAA